MGEQVNSSVWPQSTFKPKRTDEKKIFQRWGRVLTFLRGVTCFEKVMFGWSSGSRNSWDQTTPSPKWTIYIFSRSLLKGARIWCRGGYSALEQGKEDFEAAPPLSDAVLFAWRSHQLLFDLAITASSLQRRGTQRQFSENICLKDDLRSRICSEHLL